MPNWNELLAEIKTAGSVYDVLRRKYLAKLHRVTGRNVIVYYSGWLQKGILSQQGYTNFAVGDSDKNGFMATIHQLDRNLGLDLFLHTPGGDLAATESLVDYLRAMFHGDIRAIIPQLAMSAGTMIALSCKEIIMGKHSSLGPIDPQIGGIPAHGVIEEFDRAIAEVTNNPNTAPIWQVIVSKYNAALIGECQKAIDWTNQLVKAWLISGMFDGEANANTKADTIVNELGSHALTKSHSRHISIEDARNLGIKVTSLEGNDRLQDAVLTVHHACIQTISATAACKIIENHKGIAQIDTFQPVQIIR